MTGNATSIALLDPSGEVESRAEGVLAGRLGSVKGATIGLLSNQKPNVDPLLDELGRMLVDQYEVGTIIKKLKPNQSVPAEETLINELADTDAVIHGVGD